jgi:hypothetical protein
LFHPVRAFKEWRETKVELDNLPADLYPGFAEERDLLKQRLALRGIDPRHAWLEIYLCMEILEEGNMWLKNEAAVARETMELLLSAFPN